MELKKYQRRVVDEVERYLDRVMVERGKGNARHASLDAWKDLRLGQYAEHENGLGEDLPTFCIKVPTGGGKTLLATQILGSAYRTILKDRNGAGLVLWVVPSSQIYRDTLRRLAAYFEKVGKKVTWQQLGQDFQDHVFRFQILDEAQELGRDWKDELRDILSSRD